MAYCENDPLEMLKAEARHEGMPGEYVEELERTLDVARVVVVALKGLVDRVNDVTRGAGYGAGLFEPEMAEALNALRLVVAAGIAGGK